MTEETKMQIITAEVCKYYGVPLETLTTPSHERKYSEPRFVIFYFSRHKTRVKPLNIGLPFHRDRSSVYAGEKLIDGLIQVNGFAKVIDQISEAIEEALEAARKSPPVKYCPTCKQPIL